MKDEATLPLVSICIPTYQGAKTLRDTLDGIVSQAFQGLEVVVCDDASSDGTSALADDYADRFPFVRVFRNARNLGMDRNFAQTVKHATGTFVWLAGQDDLLKPGALDKLRDVIARHPDVDVVYFNYRRMSGDLRREVAPPQLDLGDDAWFTSASDYFKAIDHVPTFLAATVMRRVLWDGRSCEKFFDTHYVQTGIILRSLARARVYVVSDPRYVECRVPEDSWKRKGGQMLFEIHSGHLEVYHIVYTSPSHAIPIRIYEDKVRAFLRALPHYAVFLRRLGFRPTPLIEKRMRRLFGARPLLYWTYVWPLLHLPGWLAALAAATHRSLKSLRRRASTV